MKIKIAFYKAPGTFIDKLIRIWTKSKYSHTELIYKDEWYGISPRIKTLQKRKLNPAVDHWDFVEVEVDENHLEELYYKTNGAKYDWLGIFLSQILHLNVNNQKRWFCSEWCAAALKLGSANKYSPQKLYEKIKQKG